MLLLDKIEDPAQRLWYAQHALKGGWSRSVLESWIESDLYGRKGKAITNFKQTLPSVQSDMAEQALKDPYNLQFVTLESAKLQQLREKLDAGTSTDKIQQMKTYLKIVDEQLKAKELKVQEQLKQVDAAKKNVEAARQDYLKRNQDVEKLRLHKEEWKREEHLAAERLEGIEGDELGTSMHIRKKRKHKS